MHGPMNTKYKKGVAVLVLSFNNVIPLSKFRMCLCQTSFRISRAPKNNENWFEINVDFLHCCIPCCMLFQSLLYCSNSCTSLHFKTLKSHTKTLKIRPYMFRSPLKPSSGGPWPYFATLLNWNVDLHLL